MRTTAIDRIHDRYTEQKWDTKFEASLENNHELKSGWEFDITRQKNLLDRNFSNPINLVSQQQSNAIFIQDEWTPSDVWSHYIGFRWDQFGSNFKGENGIGTQAKTLVLNPSFQTRWIDPSDKVSQIRFALARTFKKPELPWIMQETLPKLNNNVLQPDETNNPALKPEQAWGLDLIFLHSEDSGLNYSLSYYHKHISNLLRNRLFFSDQRWQSQYINSGEAKVHGVVGDISFPLKYFSEEAPNIEFKFNASRNWSNMSDVPGPNNRFAEQAKFNSNISLDYTINDAWEIDVSYSIISGGPLRLSADRLSIVQFQRSSSFMSTWKINKGLVLRISAENLLPKPIKTEDRITIGSRSIKATSQIEKYLGVNLKLEYKF